MGETTLEQKVALLAKQVAKKRRSDVFELIGVVLLMLLAVAAIIGFFVVMVMLGVWIIGVVGGVMYSGFMWVSG